MPFSIIETCTGCTACARKCPVNAIRGERKQEHVIDPSLCIECGACGRICPSQAVLDAKGQLAERIPPARWLKPVWKYSSCVECCICITACPTGSINLAEHQVPKDGLKPSYPFLQTKETCIGCGFCEESCPASAISMKEPPPAAVLVAV
ncbi:indolepyruvate ferredoxin oxidoreductase, alpha and beta subunits [Longilinea arvoryzae]|uniref:Indolepyruvate ferredoxin oxidoreductase, alpha and beta subunits n=1 Tax=Longilinea arvoryzae TaxID=360412 RepID=A0A0S7BIK5_9CHLR|nr:4Fe-4S binding protein [Longilinea arvoryzae]GAP13697.1 indolepyruvate ferredoxin oxidoreductase, alpha and beta subunits [Longilinea arvoryzae]